MFYTAIISFIEFVRSLFNGKPEIEFSSNVAESLHFSDYRLFRSMTINNDSKTVETHAVKQARLFNITVLLGQKLVLYPIFLDIDGVVTKNIDKKFCWDIEVDGEKFTGLCIENHSFDKDDHPHAVVCLEIVPNKTGIHTLSMLVDGDITDKEKVVFDQCIFEVV